jgi:hypothetical protein
MKKIFLLAAILFATHIGMAQTSTSKKVKTKNEAKVKGTKDEDGIDGRMKGPKGEVVYIGKRGGRYYLAPDGSKVYVVAKAKKDKSKKKRK